MLAKIGEVYLSEVAVPTGILFSAQKYKDNEVTPVMALRKRMGLREPKGASLFFLIK